MQAVKLQPYKQYKSANVEIADNNSTLFHILINQKNFPTFFLFNDSLVR